jgi:hypothetical protein
MNFETILRQVSLQTFGDGKVKTIETLLPECSESLTFDHVCRLSSSIAHGSDKVKAIRICVPYMCSCSYSADDWLVCNAKLLKTIAHGSDKIAALRCTTSIFIHSQSCTAFSVGNLLRTIAHGSDQLQALRIIRQVVSTISGSVEIAILSCFAHQSDKDSARWILGLHVEVRNNQEDGDSDSDNVYAEVPVRTTCSASAATLPATALNSLLELEGNAEKTENEASQCAICMENKKTIVFHPCRHLCCCVECARTLFTSPVCPLCKAKIETAQAVFI